MFYIWSLESYTHFCLLHTHWNNCWKKFSWPTLKCIYPQIFTGIHFFCKCNSLFSLFLKTWINLDPKLLFYLSQFLNTHKITVTFVSFKSMFDKKIHYFSSPLFSQKTLVQLALVKNEIHIVPLLLSDKAKHYNFNDFQKPLFYFPHNRYLNLSSHHFL